MISYLSSEAPPLRRASAWLLKESACMAKRIDLVERYNLVAGPPGMAVARVQYEFITDRMAPQELIDFVGVCEALIEAFKKNPAQYHAG